MRCDAPGEEVYKHSDRHSLCNSGLLKQVPTRRFTDSMTSRKTSFFLYLIPSDLQETALVTVAGGRGAPVSSLWPSWVMYLRDKKCKQEKNLRKGEINCLRWRVPRKHQRRTEIVDFMREDCLTYYCTHVGEIQSWFAARLHHSLLKD